MKKILLLLIATAGLLQSALATNSTDTLPKGMNDHDLGMYYLKKSKKQKAIAWISLAGGLAMSIIGTSMYNNSIWEDNNSGTAGEVLAYTGTALTIVSIPLFIGGAKNKGRAEILLRNENIPLGLNPISKESPTSIGISFQLGK
jgi:hypothetical protein